MVKPHGCYVTFLYKLKETPALYVLLEIILLYLIVAFLT